MVKYKVQGYYYIYIDDELFPNSNRIWRVFLIPNSISICRCFLPFHFWKLEDQEGKFQNFNFFFIRKKFQNFISQRFI